MELKSKLMLATLLCTGLLATGCSQQQSMMGSQQTAQNTCPPCEQAKPPAPAPVVRRPPAPRPPPVAPVIVPKVKAKGNYKGSVQMDESSQGVMQRYQR
jgi:hypothetical protein